MLNPLLDKYLCEKYPKIFSERNGSPKETCMCQGFSINGNGWFYLIDTLCNAIQTHIDQHNKWFEAGYERQIKQGKVSQVIAKQVKEKFGGLRFYYDGGDEYIRGLVAMAEDLSLNTCELCGRIDCGVSRNSKGRIRTTCETHTNKAYIHEHLENQTKDKELYDVWQKIKNEQIQT